MAFFSKANQVELSVSSRRVWAHWSTDSLHQAALKPTATSISFYAFSDCYYLIGCLNMQKKINCKQKKVLEKKKVAMNNSV